MASINFKQTDYNYIYFKGEYSVIKELKENYTFKAPNYRWNKKYRAGFWDGNISAFNLKDCRFAAGLYNDVARYLNQQHIEFQSDVLPNTGESLSDNDVVDFYKSIDGVFDPHDSQILAFKDCISKSRNIILAPTSNGKSYIIHGLNAWHKKHGRRILIIIDRSNLVIQLKNNFVNEYKCSPIYSVSTIYDESNNTDVVISTWQSLTNKNREWFQQFDVLIGDEVHKYKAKSLLNIVDKCPHIEFRHGFTATLDNDSASDRITLIGMFGDPIQTITLRDQIDSGISSKPIIYLIVLKYNRDDINTLNKLENEEVKKLNQRQKALEGSVVFQVESNFIENHPARNKIITDIACKLSGNNLIAFKKHQHGKKLYDLICDQYKYNTYFVDSTINKDKRFEIQKKITNSNQSCMIASLGTTSTGINIPNLNNLIIATQVKSSITIPQLIGRMIRKTENKKTTNIIDIIDDLRIGRKTNIFYQHSRKRMEFYLKNGFEIKTKTINI